MASRAARGQTVALAALLAASIGLPILWPAPALSTSDPGVQQKKHELQNVHEKILTKKEHLKKLDRYLTRVATRISNSQAALDDIERKTEWARKRVAALQIEIAALQAEIDSRSRDAYILGPGTGIEMLLSAESYNDLIDRIGFLSELNLRAGRAAEELVLAQERLNAEQMELARLRISRIHLLHRLHHQRKLLQAKFQEQEALLSSLQEQRTTILAALSEIRPFARCPVDGPHAVADDFGAPRHAGGFHRHRGNDILAPYGTPIVAPFGGIAVEADNKLGGLAVKVMGEFGYVYNAHLSAFGTLGDVHTGDVIGYVGTTGDAQGGPPHDHFEWHPTIPPSTLEASPYGPTMIHGAVNPYPYLMQVC